MRGQRHDGADGDNTGSGEEKLTVFTLSVTTTALEPSQHGIDTDNEGDDQDRSVDTDPEELERTVAPA